MPTKADKPKSPSSQSTYWHESSRPLTSLIFILPMLVFYEGGVLILGPQAIRNGADVWLRQLLDLMGLGQYFMLPVLACGLLLAWHHMVRKPWRLNWTVLYGMLFESLVFGFLLVVIAGWQSRLLATSIAMGPGENAVGTPSDAGGVSRLSSATTGDAYSPGATGDSARRLTATLVAYVGAGIYEEVLFRLMLLPAVWGLLRLCTFSTRSSMVTAVIVTSLIFSGAHYQFDLIIGTFHWTTAFGEPFSWFSFLFRFIAGVTFSTLFLVRGFGITAGSHAMYDLFTLLF